MTGAVMTVAASAGISVWIGWADVLTQRQVRLDTEQVGGAG